MNQERTISRARIHAILKRFNYECVYCGGVATQVDHIVPFSFIPNDSSKNLAASCQMCNLVAGSKVFNSFEEKRTWIKRRLDKKGKLTLSIWLKPQFEELGRSLRDKIAHKVVLVETENEAREIKAILEEAGFNVR